MTDEQRAAKIAALTRELAGYEQRGLPERAAEVQAQLRALSGEAKSPHERAAKFAPKRSPRQNRK